MRVHFDISDLKDTKWYELAVRFLFGGAITAVTGLLANRYGPVFGGLFLAFPALFPASATLLEKHEREKKEKREYQIPLAGERLPLWMRAAQRSEASASSVSLLLHGNWCPCRTERSPCSQRLWCGLRFQF
jgi:hypothetical protein